MDRVLEIELSCAILGMASPSSNTRDFFGWQMILLIAVPVTLVLFLAARRSLRRFDSRLEFTEETFDRFVLSTPLPVVVHFHEPWHIGNRVMETNLKSLADRLADRVPVGFVDNEENPSIAPRFEGLEVPSVAIFYQGELLWVLEGVFYEQDVEDVLDQLERVEKLDFSRMKAESELPWERLRRAYS